MLFQGVNPLKSYKVGADVKVKVISYRVLDANKLVSFVSCCFFFVTVVLLQCLVTVG